MPRTREAQAAERRRRYHDYLDLCAEKGVETECSRWGAHRNELLNNDTKFRRLSPAELRRWWTERYTPEEIREMAASIDSLLSEIDGSTSARKVA